MAKVRFGTGVAEIRGSVGGSVYSRTHAGAIVRNRIVPVNPNTQAQDDIRGLFAAVAQLYTDLTVAQRSAWEDFAQLVNVTNVFGESYIPTGRQMFQQCNMNTALANSAVVPSGAGGPEYVFAFTPLLSPAMDYYVKPAPFSFVGDDKSYDLAVTAGDIVDFTSTANFIPPSASDDLQRVIIEATPLMRPTMRNRKTRFRLLASEAAAVADVLDVFVAYTTVYPTSGYQAGMTAGLRFSVVNKGGLRSDPIETVAVAA